MRQSAIIIGSGPNGFAAAITLARAGYEVTIHEAADDVGGGMRSAALTLPGFTHDICSAVHPLGVASPFFRSLPLHEFGLEWIDPPAPLAHPFDDQATVMLERSLDSTCAALGVDGDAYRVLFAPLVRDCDTLLEGVLAPLLPPHHPLLLARFGMKAIRSANGLARSHFRTDRAQALFAGIAAHSIMPLDALATASFGLILGMLGHAWGWPIPKGGSQRIADALAGYFTSLGGKIITGHRITTAAELERAQIVMFDTDPLQFVRIAGSRLSSGYGNRLKSYRFGAAAFKLDWALSGPIPWRSADCARAGTLHLGGTLAEIDQSERAANSGGHDKKPFVLLTQPSLFDATRAPAGQHTAWAYCHVPNGSSTDMTARIEQQVERYAPGFRDLIIGRHRMNPADLEHHNPNYVGGDVVGGRNNLAQLIARPVLRLDPYATPIEGWYLCSASTPPGGAVHGMCGYHAARSALRRFGAVA